MDRFRLLSLLGAMALGPSVEATEAPRWALVDGETSRFDLANPASEVLLGEGFRQREVVGGVPRIWTEREVAVFVVLSSPGPRTIRLEAQPNRPATRVAADFDGVPLGLATATGAPLQWHLEDAKPGPHRLTLRAFPGPDDARLPPKRVLALGEIELRPDSQARAMPLATIRPTAAKRDGLTLPAGQVLLGRVALGPQLRLVLAGGGGAVLERLRLTRAGHPEAPKPIDPQRDMAVWRNDEPRIGLVALSADSATVHLRSIEVLPDLTPCELRVSNGLVVFEALIIALGVGLAVAQRGRLRRALQRLGSQDAGVGRDLVLVFAVALALRLGWIWAYPSPPLNRLGDEIEYLVRARDLLENPGTFWTSDRWHAWQSWTRAPGYYALLAWLGITTTTRLTLFVVQAVLGAVACVATAVTARALAPQAPRIATLVAGSLMAANLEAINTTTWVMSEALMLATIAVALAALSGLGATPSRGRALFAGIALGVAALVRSATLPFLPLAVLAWWCQRGIAVRTRLSTTLLLVLGFAAVVAPWSMRSTRLAGTPVVIDTVATANLLQYYPEIGLVNSADLDLEDREDAKEYYRRVQRANADGSMAARRGEVLAAVVRHLAQDPSRTISRVAANFATFFEPFSDWYLERLAPEPRYLRLAFLTDLLNLSYLTLLAAGLIGCWWSLRQPHSWYLGLWVLLVVGAVCVVFQPDFIPGRYRLPTLPAFAALAGAAAASGCARFSAVRRRRNHRAEPTGLHAASSPPA